MLLFQTRKMSHDIISDKWPETNKPAGKMRSQSRDHTTEDQEMGLSRKSALNDRYFEDKARSRSLDNLLGDVRNHMHNIELFNCYKFSTDPNK